MADTASYAGAMTTHYPDTTPYTAKKRGDRRPGSLKGGHPIGVHRKAAQRRVDELALKRQAKGARSISPKPNANGIRSG